MKIIQTNSQMVIKQRAILQRIFSSLVLAVSLYAGIYLFINGLPGGVELNGKAVAAGSTPTILYLIIGAFALISLLILLLAADRTTTLNKGLPGATQVKRLLGAAKTEEFNTDDVSVVELVTHRPMESMNIGNGRSHSRQKQTSTLNLLLNNGAVVEVGHSNRNDSGLMALIKRAPLSKEGERIAQFLGVEFKVNANNLGDTIQHVMRSGIRGIMGGADQPTSTVVATNAAPAPNPQPEQSVAAQPQPTVVAPQAPTPAAPPQPPVVSVLPGNTPGQSNGAE